MEYFDAKKLRERRAEKSCIHSKIEKEYYADTHTMDYVCTQCGKEFTVLEMLETRDNLRRMEKLNTQIPLS